MVARGGPWWPIDTRGTRGSQEGLAKMGHHGPPGATLGEQWQPLLGRRLYAPGGLLAVAHGGPWWPMVAH